MRRTTEIIRYDSLTSMVRSKRSQYFQTTVDIALHLSIVYIIVYGKFKTLAKILTWYGVTFPSVIFYQTKSL